MVFNDRLSERRIKILKLSCKNEDAGCQWNGALEEYEQHLESCLYTAVSCPNNCPEKVLICNLESHEESCSRREHECSICKETGPYEDMILKHPLECPNVKVICQNECGAELLRCHLLPHQTICPKAIVPCAFAIAGCSASVLRENLQEHLTKNMEHHQTLACNKIQTLKTELERSEAKLRVSPVSFKLTDFTSKKEGNVRYKSPPFYSHLNGYRMCMVVRPNNDQSAHISVYVLLLQGPNDDNLEWPFKGRVTIQLLNQLSDTKHHTVVMKFKDGVDENFCGRVTDGSIRCGLGSAHVQFISHESLLRVSDSAYYPNYLKENCLYFRISVEVFSSCKPWLTCTETLEP